MVRPFQQKYNRWTGGLTTDLRTRFEVQKFARMWNFQTSNDHIIQRFGALNLSANQGHVVLFDDLTASTTNAQPTELFHNAFVIQSNGGGVNVDLIEIDGAPSLVSTTNVLAGETYAQYVVPVWYNGSVYFQTDGTNLLYGTDGVTATQVLASVTLTGDTFLVSHSQDDTLYVGSGNVIHSIEAIGGIGPFRTCLPREQIEHTLQRGDRDGNSNIANPQVITSTVWLMQNLLNQLGFPSGPVDGIFGPLTEAGVIAWQTANPPLVIDGVMGPEDAEVLNLQCIVGITEVTNALTLPQDSQITAMSEYGGYLAIATREGNGHSYVYLWDLLPAFQRLEDNSASGFDSKVDLGYGNVQILNVVDGDLMAIMSPASHSSQVHSNNVLSVKKIISTFDSIPKSRAITIAEYQLELFHLNQILYKSVPHNSKIYFMGLMNFQHFENPLSTDEGLMYGIFSINGAGGLQFEYTVSTNAADFTNGPIDSFDIVDEGFIFSNVNGTFITDVSATDVVSGFITEIINGEEPYNDKQIENVMLTVEGENTTARAEIWFREVGDIPDANAGWILVADENFNTYDTQFQQRIIQNRFADGTRFCKSREFQMMVKLFGTKGKVVDFRIIYNMLELNK